jgi:hypothetical protein
LKKYDSLVPPFTKNHSVVEDKKLYVPKHLIIIMVR